VSLTEVLAVVIPCTLTIVLSVLSFAWWLSGRISKIEQYITDKDAHCDNQKEACHQRLNRLETVQNGRT